MANGNIKVSLPKKSALKSKTIWWGHIQAALGLIAVVAPLVTHENFPNLPPWAYGSAAVVFAVVTYVLRYMTKQGIGKPGAPS